MDKKDLEFIGVRKYGGIFVDNIQYADFINLANYLSKFNLCFSDACELLSDSSSMDSYEIFHNTDATIFIRPQEYSTDDIYNIETIYVLTMENVLIKLENKVPKHGHNSITTAEEMKLSDFNILFKYDYLEDLDSQLKFVEIHRR